MTRIGRVNETNLSRSTLKMPKEKTTTRKSKAKHAGEGGKKKKGCPQLPPLEHIIN